VIEKARTRSNFRILEVKIAIIMDLGIKGRNALVMGASAGIGRGIAAALAKEGVRVAICARDEGRLKEAMAGTKAAAYVVCDLSKPGAGAQAVHEAEKKLGGAIEILIPNTGGPPKGQFPEITPEAWQVGFQGLWMSAVDSIRAALPAMKERKWGRILLVTSVAAKEPMAGLTVSNGLRAGLLGLTKSVCHEIAPYGITINALLPGFTRTERLKELGIAEEKMTGQIPAKRLADTEELGALTAFLASAHAGYITGQAITIDGGYSRGL
jgi:3-oxoacyl-[acyl-carrier protein] reductase